MVMADDLTPESELASREPTVEDLRNLCRELNQRDARYNTRSRRCDNPFCVPSASLAHETQHAPGEGCGWFNVFAQMVRGTRRTPSSRIKDRPHENHLSFSNLAAFRGKFEQ